jgi:hypothetical protein
MRSLSGLRLRDAIAVVVCLQGPLPAFGQTEFTGCIPPEPPYTALPAADLREFRSELVEDYERYFNVIGPYIQCLDEERARAMAEGSQIAAQYGKFLEGVTNDENK